VLGAGLKQIIKIIIAGIFAVSAGSSAPAQEIKQSLAPTALLPSGQAIKSCMGRKDGAECLDNLFREALRTNSTLDALQSIQRLEKDDPDIRRDCHPIVHAIGRETYRIKAIFTTRSRLAIKLAIPAVTTAPWNAFCAGKRFTLE